MLALTALVVLAGVLAMLLVAANVLERRIDDRVAGVERRFDTSVARLRRDLTKQLDTRLPPVGAATPVPTTTPAPSATPGRGASATPTASASPTRTPAASDTPTPSPQGETRP